MRDVAHDGGEQPAHLSVHGRTMERGVADDGADRQRIAVPRQPRELGDPVDVDEMSRPRQPERHDRNEALSARENATVLRAELGEHGGGFRDRSRNVTNERRGLHRQNFLRETAISFMLAASLSSSQQQPAPQA